MYQFIRSSIFWSGVFAESTYFNEICPTVINVRNQTTFCWEWEKKERKKITEQKERKIFEYYSSIIIIYFFFEHFQFRVNFNDGKYLFYFEEKAFEHP